MTRATDRTDTTDTTSSALVSASQFRRTASDKTPPATDKTLGLGPSNGYESRVTTQQEERP